MKNKLIIFSLLIVTVGVASFGFGYKNNRVKVGVLAIKIDSFKVKKNIQKADLFYAVGGAYLRSVTKGKLQKAQVLSHFIEGYPTNWISAYISVEISSRRNGFEANLFSDNNILSNAQKKLLANIDLDTEIVVKVKYNIKNAITHALEESEMNVSLTVIPEVEAEYVGGYEKMITYLKNNSIDKIGIISNMQVQSSVIKFTIGKNGKANNVKLNKTTGNTEIDALLVDLLDNMPKWNPAKNAKGKSVPQQFEFKIGGMGGC
ncbi:MAG: hypothetical protein COA88_15490 [Kordia sp.]|nr:MAG: hypothetical protein COA88_15490 [Kordia sp.]